MSMNIQQAKDQITKTISVYLQKNEQDEYIIPLERQRPIFLMGAPGIGKTAIMQQVADELNLPLVSYTMTHHTRQSAVGLPVIETRSYNGQPYKITEYTMSEILATVYAKKEEAKQPHGILFLDEINCVSETLAPAMLQFLQYKQFGQHLLPEGWLIVTAGNPPQYNRSVREFDVATLDRLKVMEVEQDYDTWRQYAVTHDMHRAVIAYLDAKKDDFYKISVSVKEKIYVTTRGWEDLSEVLKLYEMQQFEADEQLISQYIRDEKVIRDFAAFYHLYYKCQEHYNIDEILAGQASQSLVNTVIHLDLSEKINILQLLVTTLIREITHIQTQQDILKSLQNVLKPLKTSKEPIAMLQRYTEEQEQLIVQATSKEKKTKMKKLHLKLQQLHEQLKQEQAMNSTAFDSISKTYNQYVHQFTAQKQLIIAQVNEAFTFIERAMSVEQHMLLFMLSLLEHPIVHEFMATNVVQKYSEYHHILQLSDREQQLRAQIV